MRISHEQGTEKWVTWAKTKLRALTRMRKDLNLPRIIKHYSPATGVLVHINSSDFGDWIRISGGLVPIILGTHVYVNRYRLKETFDDLTTTFDQFGATLVNVKPEPITDSAPDTQFGGTASSGVGENHVYIREHAVWMGEEEIEDEEIDHGTEEFGHILGATEPFNIIMSQPGQPVETKRHMLVSYYIKHTADIVPEFSPYGEALQLPFAELSSLVWTMVPKIVFILLQEQPIVDEPDTEEEVPEWEVVNTWDFDMPEATSIFEEQYEGDFNGKYVFTETPSVAAMSFNTGLTKGVALLGQTLVFNLRRHGPPDSIDAETTGSQSFFPKRVTPVNVKMYTVDPNDLPQPHTNNRDRGDATTWTRWIERHLMHLDVTISRNADTGGIDQVECEITQAEGVTIEVTESGATIDPFSLSPFSTYFIFGGWRVARSFWDQVKVTVPTIPPP